MRTPIQSIALNALALSLLHCGSSVTPAGDSAHGTDAAADVANASDVNTDQFQSGDALLTEDATPLPGHCGPMDATGVIAPLVLTVGQTLGLTMSSIGSAFACGATPLLSGNPDQLQWSLVACGGCQACDCIDQGYQASTEIPAPAAGEYTLHVGSMTRPLRVVPADQCQPLPLSSGSDVRVEIVGPNLSLRQAGAPHLWWAHVTGNESRCCGEPVVATSVNSVRPVGADMAMTLNECSPDPCDCAGIPHPFEAWVDLGDLPPGMHGIEVPGTAAITQFEVPAMP